ncbi:MAG TPA: FHA domain-containing protein, partial [Pyrinomonadaceae bacterium]
MALLKIKDASGRQWQYPLSPQGICTIGRAIDNSVVLDDPRASRYHAYIEFRDAAYHIIDGRKTGPLIQRSSNKVLIDGQPFQEHLLSNGAQIKIGASVLLFESSPVEAVMPRFSYDDRPLGHTQ